MVLKDVFEILQQLAFMSANHKLYILSVLQIHIDAKKSSL